MRLGRNGRDFAGWVEAEAEALAAIDYAMSMLYVLVIEQDIYFIP